MECVSIVTLMACSRDALVDQWVQDWSGKFGMCIQDTSNSMSTPKRDQ